MVTISAFVQTGIRDAHEWVNEIPTVPILVLSCRLSISP